MYAITLDKKVRISAVDIVSWIEYRDMSTNILEASIDLLRDLLNDDAPIAYLRKDFKDKMKQNGHTRYDKARWTYGGLYEKSKEEGEHHE